MGCRGTMKCFLVGKAESSCGGNGRVWLSLYASLLRDDFWVCLRLCHQEQQLSWEHCCQRNRHNSIRVFVLLVNVIQYQPPKTHKFTPVSIWFNSVFFFRHSFISYPSQLVLFRAHLYWVPEQNPRFFIKLMNPCFHCARRGRKCHLQNSSQLNQSKRYKHHVQERGCG